ncbi:IniB N-terminal domain-containing protein [Pseudarthrobacter phenanthrenivorans]|uniref:IniB N-terminal domain-containing protein n=1 Tax=Pseudarthrobacter phenanthrenivorans TaxID=361575 RepID=UPI002F361120
MPTLANDLVQFLMQLFGDREAVRAFLADPERALAEHGLGNVCSADVDAAMPVVLDYAPITVNASALDRAPTAGVHSAWGGQAGPTAAHAGAMPAVYAGGHGPGQGGTYDHDDHANAVQQLHHVVNHFSYTTNTTLLDDRGIFTDQSVSQNIWAHGDVEQWFDNAAAAATGDHAVSAGDGAGARDAGNIRDSYSTDHSMDQSTHVGADAGMGSGQSDSFDTDVALDTDNSFDDNLDHAHGMEGHLDTTDPAGHSVSMDTAPDVGDSSSDNSTHTFIQAGDPYNPDTSTGTAAEMHVDDSFHDHAATGLMEGDLGEADNQLGLPEDNSAHTDADLDHHAPIDDATAL